MLLVLKLNSEITIVQRVIDLFIFSF